MALVKVWNDNIYLYEEKFRGRLIEIDPNSYIEMDEDEAENFKAAFTFPHRDEQGRPDPRFFKKIRIEKPKVEESADDNLICHANGQKVSSVDELTKVLSNFSHMLAKDDEAEAEAKKHLKKENKELKERLSTIEKLLEEQLGVKIGEKK